MTKARDIASAAPVPSAISATELGYLDGVTSAIQTQLNGKEPLLPSQSGNAGKYLTTDGTNESWGTISAGGMTVLASGNLSGIGTTLNLTGISAGYKDLLLVLRGYALSATNVMCMRINNLSTTNYYYQKVANSRTTITNVAGQTQMDFDITTQLSATANQALYVRIIDYANTTSSKIIEAINSNGTTGNISRIFGNFIATTGNGAVNQIQLSTFSTQTFSAGTYILYGVN
jgi:hypothetical protein